MQYFIYFLFFIFPIIIVINQVSLIFACIILIIRTKNIDLYYQKNIETTSQLEVILKQTRSIYRVISYARYLKGNALSPSEYVSILKYFTVLLIDLRSDLTLRLAEQQSTLEQAKSEVSTHIH